MQPLNTNDLEKRSRYYQGKMDVVLLEKGADVTYNGLNKFTNILDKSVKKARENKKWRDEYMSIEMQNRIIKAQGKAEGIVEGEAIVFDVIDRINKGETAESIISSGIDEATVNRAMDLFNNITAR